MYSIDIEGHSDGELDYAIRQLEAYANFFLYRWMHTRKHGLERMVEYLTSRVFGTPKSHLFDDYGEESESWPRK